MPMVSMELDDEAKHDYEGPAAAVEKPDFPYGLRICFTDAELEKLDIDPAEAFHGAIFHMKAICCITNVSLSDGDGGKCVRVEAQITAMSVDDNGEEEPDGD